MAGISTAGKNLMLNAFAGSAVFYSLHSADPLDAGTSELSGGSPAYARKAATWNSAAAGALDNSNAPVFDVPSGATVAFVGYWSAVSAGTFYGSSAVTSESFSGQGTYTLNDADVTLT